MAHTGMFVAPAAGTPPVGMTATDGRLVMGGVFQVAPQIVSTQLGGYAASGSSMAITVRQTVWSIPDPTNTAAVFFSPTDQLNLTFSAAPATGGRIDLVVVKQNNVENGDADSRVNVTVVTGTPSGSPVAPATPAGAAVYLSFLINAGITNMAAATVTNYMQSQYAFPPLQAASLAALNTVTGVSSQLAIVTADATPTNNGLYIWAGTFWAPNGACNPHFQYLKTGGFSFTSTTTVHTWDASPTDGVLAGFSTSDQKTFTCTIPGVYQIAVNITANSSSNGLTLYLTPSSGNQVRGYAAASSTQFQSVFASTTHRFAIGDSFTVSLGGSGTTAGVPGTGCYMNVDYLHG